MSRYIHPGRPICERYTNLLKGHKFEGLILVGERNMILRRKGVTLPVYYLFYGDLPDVEFFASQRYINVAE